MPEDEPVTMADLPSSCILTPLIELEAACLAVAKDCLAQAETSLSATSAAARAAVTEEVGFRLRAVLRRADMLEGKWSMP